MKKILDIPMSVVFGSQVNGLGIIRSLGENGIPVLALDHNPKAIGLFSKYCEGVVYPNPVEDELSFVNFLTDIGKNLKNKALLFPTDDVWLITVSKYRKELENYYIFPMSDWNVIQNCIDKERMYQVALRTGIPIPKTLILNDFSNLESVCTKFEYPCIVKPTIPSEFDKKFKRRTLKISNINELIEWVRENERILEENNIKILLQEILPGDASLLYTFSAYSNTKAEIVAFSVIRKILQNPPDFGTIALGEVIREPEVIELGSKLIKAFGYYGLSNTEFKKDLRDGKFKLMEINARSGKSIYYTTKCGVNLPLIAYEEAVKSKLSISSSLEGTYGKEWFVSPMDNIVCFIKELMSNAWKNRKPRLLKRCLNFVKPSKRRIHAVYSLRDPFPGLAYTYSYLVLATKKVFSIFKK